MNRRLAAFIFGLFIASPVATSQNVTGYDAMPDPYLFLLREPAVQKDLGLNASQMKQLVEINESFDGTLLGMRNKKDAQENQRKTDDVMRKTRAAVGLLFSAKQQERIQQIAFRLKGMSFVLVPAAAKQLELTAEQTATINAAIKDASETIRSVQSREFQGQKEHQASQRTVAAARKREQEAIVAALNDSQKRKLVALIGKPFDPSTLGRVAFKAPEVIDSGQWINSEGGKLSDLRGKVVALHFFAFG
ncbi:hypothetical protein [Planctomycetes bacterium K23_9]|uniref:Uncharacterized protein n=1 Tax=Stieleria marina TaxID=1930275 RepID=A0A517NS67_9BACT|nr:hypothetical protein K239x_19350 [Planctomycetes bacterium K23_9]